MKPALMEYDLKARLPSLLLGFMALSYQIVLMREFSAIFFGNELTIGILLAFWLFWSGAGSLSGPRFNFSKWTITRIYFLLILLFPLCLGLLRLSRFFWGRLPGEITGLFPALPAALIITFLTAFPFGLLFYANASRLNNDPGRVYRLECLGSGAAGLIVYFILIPGFTNWQITAVISWISLIVLAPLIKSNKNLYIHLSLIPYLMLVWLCDIPLQKKAWLPYQLVLSRDTRIGKWQIIKEKEVFSFYLNGIRAVTVPKTAAEMDMVHLALLHLEHGSRILLLGGVSPDILREALKYPVNQIETVERDPELYILYERLLPSSISSVFNNPRIHRHSIDGRIFLKNDKGGFDAVIIGLPDPGSIQLNRFYSHEFFELAANRLREKGLLCFQVSAAENYISRELQDYISSIYSTLKLSFSQIVMIPGDKIIFLASNSDLQITPEIIKSKTSRIFPENYIILNSILEARLDPLRMSLLRIQISNNSSRINYDRNPTSYYYNSLLWSSRFNKLESRVLKFFSSAGRHIVFHIPLIIMLLLMLAAGRKNPSSAVPLISIFMLGFTTILIEMIILLFFQIQHGNLYHTMAMLFSGFMFGLAGGAWAGERPAVKGKTGIFLPGTALFISLLLLKAAFIFNTIPPVFYFLYLSIIGFIGGWMFVMATRLHLQKSRHIGLGYALDLIGSFSGALVTSSILIPVFGLELILNYILAANFIFLTWLALFTRRNKQVQP